jgi:hypothetical protein
MEQPAKPSQTSAPIEEEKRRNTDNRIALDCDLTKPENLDMGAP